MTQRLSARSRFAIGTHSTGPGQQHRDWVWAGTEMSGDGCPAVHRLSSWHSTLVDSKGFFIVACIRGGGVIYRAFGRHYSHKHHPFGWCCQMRRAWNGDPGASRLTCPSLPLLFPGCVCYHQCQSSLCGCEWYWFLHCFSVQGGPHSDQDAGMEWSWNSIRIKQNGSRIAGWYTHPWDRTA